MFDVAEGMEVFKTKAYQKLHLEVLGTADIETRYLMHFLALLHWNLCMCTCMCVYVMCIMCLFLVIALLGCNPHTIHEFKVYNPIVLAVFTKLCNNHNSNFRIFSSSEKEILYL